MFLLSALNLLRTEIVQNLEFLPHASTFFLFFVPIPESGRKFLFLCEEKLQDAMLGVLTQFFLQEMVEVVDLVSSDSEDEVCVHSPDRKRPAWEPDPFRGPGSSCARTGGHDRGSVPDHTTSRRARPPHQLGEAVKKDKEKVDEGESAWEAAASSLTGGASGVGTDSWSARVSASGHGGNERTEWCWGDHAGRSVTVPKDDAAMPGQSSTEIPYCLREDSTSWLSRIKGLHFPLPDEHQLRARQIESDEMLALKLQEQFNEEHPGSQASQQVCFSWLLPTTVVPIKWKFRSLVVSSRCTFSASDDSLLMQVY